MPRKAAEDISDGLKFCPDCGTRRPLAEFYSVRAPRYSGGVRYSAYCRAHTVQRNTAARAQAPEGSGIKEAVKRANKKWAEENPEANREAQARWRAAHPEEAAQRHRDWQLRNPEKNREKARRYYQRKKKGETGTGAENETT